MIVLNVDLTMSTPRIFYLCYDNNRPVGGEKESYQHVDVLNRNGFDAYVLHNTRGFRLTWFPNTTRVVSRHEVTLNPCSDIMVLPENLGLRILAIPGRKVIFNKGIYSGFGALGLSPLGSRVYLSDDVIAILSMSSHNSKHLTFAYGSKPVLTVLPDIKPETFTYRPLESKQLRIAYATKASGHGRTLYQLLSARATIGLNRLQSVTWIPIVDLHERDVVAELQRALLFVFLSVDEGMPRLPLEAMACGCLVCAYNTGPLAATLPREYRFDYGDLISMARYIEEIVEAYPDRLSDYELVTREARRYAERFSCDEQARTVASAWSDIIRLVT